MDRINRTPYAALDMQSGQSKKWTLGERRARRRWIVRDVHEEAVPEEGAFEDKVDEGVEEVPDEEDAGFCARREDAYAATRTATVQRSEKVVVWSICRGAGKLVGILERLKSEKI